MPIKHGANKITVIWNMKPTKKLLIETLNQQNNSQFKHETKKTLDN